jgi:hypothetical protein
MTEIIRQARNIMVNDVWKEGKNRNITAKVACDCGYDKHIMGVEIDVDGEAPNQMSLRLYQSLDKKYYESNLDGAFKKFFKSIWFRIKNSFIMLTRGSLEMEGWIIIGGESEINNFIKLLQEGRDFCCKEEIHSCSTCKLLDENSYCRVGITRILIIDPEKYNCGLWKERKK